MFFPGQGTYCAAHHGGVELFDGWYDAQDGITPSPNRRSEVVATLKSYNDFSKLSTTQQANVVGDLKRISTFIMSMDENDLEPVEGNAYKEAMREAGGDPITFAVKMIQEGWLISSWVAWMDANKYTVNAAFLSALQGYYNSVSFKDLFCFSKNFLFFSLIIFFPTHTLATQNSRQVLPTQV